MAMSEDDTKPIIEFVREGWNNSALLLALALGVAVTIAAAVILARVGEDHHADE